MRTALALGLFTSGLLALFSAQAQDAAPAPTIDWNGFYIGAIGGGISADFDAEASGGAAPRAEINYGSFDFSDTNGFAGGEIGIGHQVGGFVFGVVADALGTDLQDSGTFGPISIPQSTATLNGAVGVALEWLATVRGKAGVTNGPMFFYVTGGLAFGEIDAAVGVNIDIPTTPTPSLSAKAGLPLGASPLSDLGSYDLSDRDEDLGVGFAVGAGAAFQVPAGFVLDLSYLYVNLGDTDFDFEFSPRTIGNAEVGFDAHLGRAALSYHF